ncbi:MAG: hypothetical protein ABIR11_03160 [Candidatus Limnocylindrales bacterium]
MDTIITTLIDGALVPFVTFVTSPIGFVASSGILLLVFVGLWVAFAVAIAREPDGIDAAWHRLRTMPLLVQAAAWLVLLPVLAGIWIWRTSWPTAARLTLVAGLAGWNLLVFLPTPG